MHESAVPTFDRRGPVRTEGRQSHEDPTGTGEPVEGKNVFRSPPSLLRRVVRHYGDRRFRMISFPRGEEVNFCARGGDIR